MTTMSATAPAVRPRALDRASWGALFAGFFVGIGTLFLLLSLGAAIGLTGVDPGDLGSWKAMGIGAGVWGGISAIIAAFFSAWVASRLCTATDRGGGMLHGVALWGLTWAVSLWIAAMAIGGVIGTATSAASSAAGAAGGALSSLSASAVTDQALQQANAWLRQNGKRAVTRQQMEATIQAIAANAAQRVRAGESPAAALQQDAIVSSLARNTNLSAGDAEQLAAQLRGQLERAASGASAQAPAVAEAATSGASKGAWGAFLAALLTLLASAAGGAAGVPARARREAVEAALPAGHLRPQHT